MHIKVRWVSVLWGAGPLSTEIAGCLRHMATWWECSGALKNPSVSRVCVLVLHQDRSLTSWNVWYCVRTNRVSIFGWHRVFPVVQFHWNHRNKLVYNKSQPISSGTEQAYGPVDLWDECLCQHYESVLNLVWMWSEPHRKEPLTARSLLVSPGPVCYARFVVDLFVALRCLCCSSHGNSDTLDCTVTVLKM